MLSSVTYEETDAQEILSFLPVTQLINDGAKFKPLLCDFKACAKNHCTLVPLNTTKLGYTKPGH